MFLSKLRIALACALLLLGAGASAKIHSSVPASRRGGVITLKTPARPAGQQHALKMTAEPIPIVRVGFIGVGSRGTGAIGRYIHIENARIVAVCDLVQENIDNVQARLLKAGYPTEVDSYVGEDTWKQVCERDDIDLIYICTDWVHHTPMAVYAMEHGKHVAVEVPAATSIAECWQLVNTCERTRRHCMMLENCVYDFFEVTTLAMAQQGLFGELYFGEGGYIHNLDAVWTRYWDNWRIKFNRDHRGDNYPTHGLGPLCQVFDIHRGDRMVTLVSMDSKPVHSAEKGRELVDAAEFAEGDHTVTLIRTAKDRMIQIQHNVYASRPYSRLYALTGSDGYAVKYPEPHICLKPEKMPERIAYDDLGSEKFLPEKEYEALMALYEPAFVSEIKETAKKVGGHGGMDYIMDYRLIWCLQHGLPLDQDVYDAAEWCSLVELSRLSIEGGNAPVAVPDFTRGYWDLLPGYTYGF